jgi:hypothetical protein
MVSPRELPKQKHSAAENGPRKPRLVTVRIEKPAISFQRTREVAIRIEKPPVESQRQSQVTVRVEMPRIDKISGCDSTRKLE